MGITIKIAGRVWYDSLDPAATAMEGELELPAREWRNVGKGSQAIYEDVPLDVAEELASYLIDRAWLLLSNSDPEYEQRERSTYRAMAKVGEKIRADVKHARQVAMLKSATSAGMLDTSTGTMVKTRFTDEERASLKRQNKAIGEGLRGES